MGYKALVLKPGECAVLPKTATITSVIVDGDGQVSSTCDNLPDPVDYQCWVFTWEVSTGNAPLDDATFDSLIIGDNTYTVPSLYSDYNADFSGIHWGGNALPDWLQADPTLAGIVVYGCSTESGVNRMMKIKVPPGIGTPILKVKNPTGLGTDYMYIYAVEDSDCDTCSF
jgi:hypothetical protein